MSSPTTSLEIPALRDAFVRPLYLRLLHGNFTHLSEADGEGFRRAAQARPVLFRMNRSGDC
jgi:hypothetical protein